jgi:hypothetical protein
MKGRYKYASSWEKVSLKKHIQIWLTDLALKLYRNKLFQKLKLDWNPVIKVSVQHDDAEIRINRNDLPKQTSFKPYSLSFFDIIPMEELDKFKLNFISLVSSFKGGFLSKYPEDLHRIFKDFESSYKGVSFGHLYTNDLKNNDEIDLIDQVSFDYVKGPQSTFIIEYKIFPSKKFLKRFNKKLIADGQRQTIIHFNSLKDIFKKKQFAGRIMHHYIDSNYHLNRLIQDLNFQVKTYFSNKLVSGFFQNSLHHLFPCIATYEVDKAEYIEHERNFQQVLEVASWDTYKTESGDLIFSFSTPRLSKKSFEKMNIIFLKEPPATTETTDVNASLKTTSYLSTNYIHAISPFWSCLNFIALNQTKIIDQRKRTFNYLKRNKDSLFLKEAIKLKYQISQNWLNVYRTVKDYRSNLFKRQLHFHEIPRATNEIFQKVNVFTEVLWNYTETAGKDIIDEYDEIKNTFGQISEDNVTRSNMKIQKILFFLTIVGIPFAIYSSNSDYFNSWIEYFLKLWFNITIPRV